MPLPVLPYDRKAALRYAHRWAYSRNPAYYDYENLGGDCTNFASQCLYAGTGVMNLRPHAGGGVGGGAGHPGEHPGGRPQLRRRLAAAEHLFL